MLGVFLMLPAALNAQQKLVDTVKTPYPEVTSPIIFHATRKEPVAYVAESASLLIFQTHNWVEGAELELDLPVGIKLVAAIRNLSWKDPQQITVKGQAYQRYTLAKNPGASPGWWHILWKSDTDLGQSAKAYYRTLYQGKADHESELSIRSLQLPKLRTFNKLPVYFSIPSDLMKIWPADDFRRGGFNAVDIWAYMHPNHRGWALPLVHNVKQNLKGSGVELWAWPMSWWWNIANSTEDGKATTITGKRVRKVSLQYRGEWYQKWIDAGKLLLDQGIYTHSSDPEFYHIVGTNNADETVGFSAASLAEFKQWVKQQNLSLKNTDAKFFMNKENKAQYPEEVRAFRRYKAHRFNQFFVDYRHAMQTHLKAKGEDPKKFKFVIYSTYHRAMGSFFAYKNFEDSPSFIWAYENPKDLPEAFDIIAPMVYPDIYGEGSFGTYGPSKNYSKMNMLGPWEDTSSLHKLIGNRSVIAPILSSGYSYSSTPSYRADMPTHMLLANIMEVFASGGKGFGIWGATNHDAYDMQQVAKLVDGLVDAENIIQHGSPFEAQPVSGKAFVKGITAAEGALLLVSEYSGKGQQVTVSVPVEGEVVDCYSGEKMGRLQKGGNFTIRLTSKTPARIFRIIKAK